MHPTWFHWSGVITALKYNNQPKDRQGFVTQEVFCKDGQFLPSLSLASLMLKIYIQKMTSLFTLKWLACLRKPVSSKTGPLPPIHFLKGHTKLYNLFRALLEDVKQTQNNTEACFIDACKNEVRFLGLFLAQRQKSVLNFGFVRKV